MVTRYIPNPIFDTLSETQLMYREIIGSDDPRNTIKNHLKKCFINSTVKSPTFSVKDYHAAICYLNSYRGNMQTFNAYRRDIERLLQWSWFVQEKSILILTKDDIELFLEFCIKPYKRWIGLKTVARFKSVNGEKIPNPVWRPFEASISKKDVKAGIAPTKDDYELSQKAIKALFAVMSSFYTYCMQEEICTANPIALIRQKSRFLRKESTKTIRRLSDKQWQTVLSYANEAADKDVKYERVLFILTCLYGMYLRISELTASDRWTPTMGDFFKDTDGNWWFKTVGKGNKSRQIAVSDQMLKALKRYRKKYLNLPPYPTVNESTPLISHLTNDNRPMTDERTIRRLVQECFDAAADKLQVSDPEEAASLQSATVHWLRHTGISDDVKHRPREHVRDDAGHSSGAITDLYIDDQLTERAKSAKNKVISGDFE